MTKQEMFDQAARGILAQGGPSVVGGVCQYRGSNCRKCAAGHLIPDDYYNAAFEGAGCGPLTEDEKAPQMLPYESASDFADRLMTLTRRLRLTDTMTRLGLDLDFARNLQVAHDFSKVGRGDEAFLDEWSRRMRQLAVVHDLSAAVLDVVVQP